MGTWARNRSDLSVIKKDITPLESIQENLDTWCYEVGSRFEEIGVDAAMEFISWWKYINNIQSHHYLTNKDFFITELGCGDGASTNYFADQGFIINAVDINKEKLDKLSHININPINLSTKIYLEYGLQPENIFTHHSLEHMIEAKEIIELCGEKLKSGGLYYATVPAGDYLHSVHHIVFEDELELLPSSLELVIAMERERFGEKEFLCIATKE